MNDWGVGGRGGSQGDSVHVHRCTLGGTTYKVAHFEGNRLYRLNSAKLLNKLRIKQTIVTNPGVRESITRAPTLYHQKCLNNKVFS